MNFNFVSWPNNFSILLCVWALTCAFKIVSVLHSLCHSMASEDTPQQLLMVIGVLCKYWCFQLCIQLKFPPLCLYSDNNNTLSLHYVCFIFKEFKRLIGHSAKLLMAGWYHDEYSSENTPPTHTHTKRSLFGQIRVKFRSIAKPARMTFPQAPSGFQCLWEGIGTRKGD